MSVPNLGDLTPSEARWIDYVRNVVVGKLAGSAQDRARTAAIVTWWALKEGVLDLPNPWRHSICSPGNRKLGDLETCPGGVWQVGLAGIQVGSATDAQVESVASRLYPGQSLEAILSSIAADAGVDGPTAQAIVTSTGPLRRSWLLRDPAVAFTIQRPFVESQCLNGAASWCYGTWDTARRFASSRARIDEVVRALEDYFGGAPSARAFPWLLALAIGGGAAYWYYKQDGKRVLARAFSF